MKQFLSCFVLVSVLAPWAEAHRLIYVPPPKNPNRSLEIYFQTPKETKKTAPFAPYVAEGPEMVDSDGSDISRPSEVARTFAFGIEIYDAQGKIVYSGSRTDTLELPLGVYTIKSWSDSNEIQIPEDITIELGSGLVKTVQLYFKSDSLSIDQIDQSLF